MKLSEEIELYKKGKLLEGLYQCTEAQITLFKRMYSHGNLELAIEQVVANMPIDKIDWAIKQVETTIAKNEKDFRTKHKID